MENESVLIVALVSTVAFLTYLLFGGSLVESAEGLDGADVSDISDSGGWSVLQFLSIQGVLLAVMSGSWSWLFWNRELDSAAMTLAMSAVSAASMMTLYVYGMKLIARLNSPHRLKGFEVREGMNAKVYARIPANNGGVGVVTFMDSVVGDIEMNATTESETDIENGAGVVVVRVDGKIVVVRRAS